MNIKVMGRNKRALLSRGERKHLENGGGGDHKNVLYSGERCGESIFRSGLYAEPDNVEGK